MFLIAIAFYYLIDPDWSGIILGTYPILAYVFFIWKGKQFSTSNDKKQERKTAISLLIMGSVFLAIVAMFFYSLQDNTIEIQHNILKISGDYGMELKISEIESMELVDELPVITSKANGFALQTVQKGYFKTESGEIVKLLINSSNSPIIRIITKDHQKIYYSSKNKSNPIIFKECKQKMGK